MTQPTSNVVEVTVDLITKYIQENIGPALAAKSAVTDKSVSLEVPRSYFIYEAFGYQAPAVFVIPEDVDFRQNKGANFICALCQINVAVVIENSSTENLARQSFRYQEALHQLLAQEPILSADETVKLVVKITSAKFSPMYSYQDPKSPKARFRKEVWLMCQVEHYEKLF